MVKLNDKGDDSCGERIQYAWYKVSPANSLNTILSKRWTVAVMILNHKA
jgi:hypothetical protein